MTVAQIKRGRLLNFIVFTPISLDCWIRILAVHAQCFPVYFYLLEYSKLDRVLREFIVGSLLAAVISKRREGCPKDEALQQFAIAKSGKL